ncbi:hypothetical protein E1262_26180 [Jiangella aurantiaca]|uniref:DUF3107 domain-containing protein n=1 Tax=Jiangella aurantiaca TaxID=2530373 RepID=A0A4R5A163_9ACTN|nr:hypothetical protein [Jiangella aurantiaca]TDD65145.1 hypothetical protein E1262_26180 [Jiangella aurantiaca]
MTATAVLRVKFVGGAHMDVTIEGTDVDEDELVDHAISALATSSGMLRARHGDRLVVVFARGVAAVEVAPRGAVL